MPQKAPQKSAAKPRVSRTERLETRVTEKQKDLISQAADILGVTTSQFVVRTAVGHAKRVLRDDDLIRVNARDRELLVAALMNPAEPTQTLREAWEDFKAVST